MHERVIQCMTYLTKYLLLHNVFLSLQLITAFYMVFIWSASNIILFYDDFFLKKSLSVPVSHVKMVALVLMKLVDLCANVCLDIKVSTAMKVNN